MALGTEEKPWLYSHSKSQCFESMAPWHRITPYYTAEDFQCQSLRLDTHREDHAGFVPTTVSSTLMTWCCRCNGYEWPSKIGEKQTHLTIFAITADKHCWSICLGQFQLLSWHETIPCWNDALVVKFEYLFLESIRHHLISERPLSDIILRILAVFRESDGRQLHAEKQSCQSIVLYE